MTAHCPECGGSQLAGNPAGWLAVRHTLTCGLRAADDQTAAADAFGDNWAGAATVWNPRIPAYQRPATAAEKTILRGLGYVIPDDLADSLVTQVEPVVFSGSILRRAWPQLETTKWTAETSYGWSQIWQTTDDTGEDTLMGVSEPGISGDTPPSVPDTAGGSVQDGSVKWVRS